jgi:GGDEF domain-containing protein
VRARRRERARDEARVPGSGAARHIVSAGDGWRRNGGLVGHVGGDDFMLLMQSADWEERCRTIIRQFDNDAVQLFDDTARRAVVTRYHSLSQAHATAFMVLDADAAFAPLLAIQLAAFLMTLVRKGFISTTT